MAEKEKGRPGEGSPIPQSIPTTGQAEFKSSPNKLQAADTLARQVFGHGFLVVREPIGERFRQRASTRIRAWRAPA